MRLTDGQFIRLCRARDLLAAVEVKGVSIEDAAREACVSKFHFIRRFRAVFGVTPHQYRIQQSIDQARILLARGQHSVTEVCFEVGFESLGSFSDLFARRVGMSPSEFRRNIRASVQVPGEISPIYFPGCLSLMARLPASVFRNFQEAPIQNQPLQSA